MKRRVLISMLLVIISVTAKAQSDSLSAGNVWSLKQCIEYALGNSLVVKRSTYNAETSEVDLRQAQFSRLPTLSASGSYGFSWGRGIDPTSNDFVTDQITLANASVNASLPLFNGLRIQNSVRQYRHSYNASK